MRRMVRITRMLTDCFWIDLSNGIGTSPGGEGRGTIRAIYICHVFHLYTPRRIGKVNQSAAIPERFTRNTTLLPLAKEMERGAHLSSRLFIIYTAPPVPGNADHYLQFLYTNTNKYTFFVKDQLGEVRLLPRQVAFYVSSLCLLRAGGSVFFAASKEIPFFTAKTIFTLTSINTPAPSAWTALFSTNGGENGFKAGRTGAGAGTHHHPATGRPRARVGERKGPDSLTFLKDSRHRKPGTAPFLFFFARLRLFLRLFYKPRRYRETGQPASRNLPPITKRLT